MIRRIVSGGQTGADRAALDFALQAGIECGGWVPRGRNAEDGVIPAKYPNLLETDSDHPNERTALNVRHSQATLLITRGEPIGGSAYTMEIAARFGKPVLHIDFNCIPVTLASRRLGRWLRDIQPATLNVAGSRHSEDPEIYGLTMRLLGCTLWFC